MKKILVILLSSLGYLIYSQKITFTPDIIVFYDSTLKLGENYKKDQKFVLFGNSQNYYFGAYQNYLNDTDQYEPSSGIDLVSISDYFKERVIKSGGITNTFISVTSTKIRYQENVNLKWVLYKDTKIIGGVKCQMAATNKYGRRWIAYFSDEYPVSIGPYKFSGLPGLIFELYDTRDDYHFTLTKVEKFKKDFDFNLNGFKLYLKDKYLQAKFNLEFTAAALPSLEGEMRKNYDEMMKRKQKRYNNPIELNPLEN